MLSYYRYEPLSNVACELYINTADKYEKMGNIDVAIENLSIANSLIALFADLSELLKDVASRQARIYRNSDNVLLSLYWTRISGSQDQKSKWRKKFGLPALLESQKNRIEPKFSEAVQKKQGHSKENKVSIFSGVGGQVVGIAVTVTISLVVGVVIGRKVDRK